MTSLPSCIKCGSGGALDFREVHPRAILAPLSTLHKDHLALFFQPLCSDPNGFNHTIKYLDRGRCVELFTVGSNLYIVVPFSVRYGSLQAVLIW